MKTSEAPVESAPLLKRVATILHELEQNDALELSTSDALTLTDQGLLEHILNAHTQNLHHDPKIIKKLKRQRAGQKKFIEYIERHGGAVKQTEFAEFIGVTRQVIRKKVLENYLITIKSGATRKVPLFQIDTVTNQIIFGLDRVNAELAKKELGTPSICTFWLNSRSRFDGLSARDYLQQNQTESALEDVLFLARREGDMGF
ncbi:hypothetical protein [Vibrio harveyi]|uniref:hypothetical protein n=1 Tax=Vibrio harveyi TaxID=669 RepID=UPI00237FE0BD|nr:hypothetical protein [Vibrio harveyi]